MILRNNKTIITHNIKNNNIKYSKNAIVAFESFESVGLLYTDLHCPWQNVIKTLQGFVSELSYLRKSKSNTEFNHSFRTLVINKLVNMDVLKTVGWTE